MAWQQRLFSRQDKIGTRFYYLVIIHVFICVFNSLKLLVIHFQVKCLSNLHILVLWVTHFYHPQITASHLSSNITMWRRGVMPTSIPRVSLEFVFCPWFSNYAHSLETNQETTWFRVPKLIFVKRLIWLIPFNHYMCFNLNDTHRVNCVSLNSVQGLIEIEAWLLLTFFLCLHNQLTSIDSNVTY